MTINGPDSDSCLVRYDHIVSMTLVDSFDPGEPVSGDSGRKYSSGTWKNDEFGEYFLCIQNNIKRYIIVETGEKAIAFNFESNEATNEFYSAILKMF